MSPLLLLLLLLHVGPSRLLGDMVLNLWDCGGQDSFYETYFNVQQDFIFRSVEVCRRSACRVSSCVEWDDAIYAWYAWVDGGNVDEIVLGLTAALLWND